MNLLDLEKYAVVSQDRTIFSKFEEALERESVKISSSLAAKTFFRDEGSTFDLVIVDLDLKGSGSVIEALNSYDIPYLVIGEDLSKPLDTEMIKRKVYDKLSGEHENSIKAIETKTIQDSVEEIEIESIKDDPDEFTYALMEAICGKENITFEKKQGEKESEILKELDEIWDEQKNSKSDVKVAAAPAVKIARQLVAAVWSAKAGVGKTFITCNLGVIYAQAGFKTLIIDGDILNLSVGIHLNLMDINKTLEKALKETDSKKYMDYVIQHPQIKDLFIISGSEICRPENYSDILEGSMGSLINAMRDKFDVILIDTATDLSFSTTYEALKTANMIISLTSQDYALVFNTKKYNSLLTRLNISPEKIYFILNNEFRSSKINKEIIEKALEIKINNVIPNCYEKVTESIFDSRPIALYNTVETQQIRDSLVKLASDIYPYLERKTEINKGSAPFLKRLLKGRGK